MKLRSYLLFVVALIVGLGGMLATRVFAGKYEYQGSVFNPPAPAGDIQLVDQNGNPFQLSDQTGYTNCLDVCPITMAELKQVKTELKDQADKVSVVFVTTDPDRDSSGVVKDYLAKFDPSFVGLTGNLAELQPAWHAYGVYQAKIDAGHKDNQTNSANYEVDHSTRVYVIDQNGDLRMTFPYGMEVSAMVSDLTHLLKESPKHQ
jgi:protein SCO1/2